MSIEALSPEWIDALVLASAERRSVVGLGGVVSIAIGKTKSATFEIADGRVGGSSDAIAETLLPLTAKQLTAWANGELSLSAAYMVGDVKPVGATGPLLALLDVLDDDAVRRAMG